MREAQEKMRAPLTAADNGAAAHVRPRTIESYAATVRPYIVPAIGRIALAKLQAEDINRMTARLAARGNLSDTTIRYVYVVLRIALGEALRLKRVVRDVALEVRAPKATQRERTPLTLDQVATFLDSVASDRLGACT